MSTSAVSLQPSTSQNQKSTQNVAYTTIPPSSLYYMPMATTSSSMWQPPAHWNVQPAPVAPVVKRKVPKTKHRTKEEREIMGQTAERFSARLAADHNAVLYPDTETPFTDTVDAANRLLPYHVFQQPRDDLVSCRKGKQKASELESEIEETRFALDCHKRLRRLEERFRNARTNSGKRSSPSDQAFVLAQAVVETERAELATLTTEVREARTELDRIERQKRAANAPPRMSYYPNAGNSSSTVPTTQTPVTQSPYYRGYSYTYTQPYGALMSPFSVAATAPKTTQATSTSTSSVTVAPTATVPSAQPTAAAQAVTGNRINPLSLLSQLRLPGNNYAPPVGAIPVQLPTTSLPALHALGIVPVPASSIPQADGKTPAAILKGSSADGSMLSLEINVSLLQTAQMNGLALFLNSIIQRNHQAALAASLSTSGTQGTTSAVIPATVAPAATTKVAGAASTVGTSK